MSKYVSENARELLDIITREHALQAERVAGGFINTDQMMQCLIERLNVLSQRNPSLRQFLADTGHIPKEDDEAPDRPWAPDPRPPNQNFVEHRPSEPEATERLNDDDWINSAWPAPGERVC